MSASLSIVLALFTAPTGLPGAPNFLFLVVTVIKPSLDYVELGKCMLPAGVSLNIGVCDTFAATGKSLGIVLRIVLAL